MLGNIRKYILYLIRLVRIIGTRKVSTFLRKIRYPGRKEINLSQVGYFLYYGLKNGKLRTRAAALSFRILLTAIPFVSALMVLLGLVSSLTGEEVLIAQVIQVMPEAVQTYITDVIGHLEQSEITNVASVGIVLAIFYARKAFREIFVEFYLSELKSSNRRAWYEIEIISVVLVIISLILITTMLVTYVLIRRYLIVNDFDFWTHVGVVAIEGVVLFLFLSLWLSIIYAMGTRSKERVFKFFSPGMVITALVIMIYSWFFFKFIFYISAYNEYYGFLGAGIISMMWLYTCSYFLIIGFELNESIKSAIWNMDRIKTKS